MPYHACAWLHYAGISYHDYKAAVDACMNGDCAAYRAIGQRLLNAGFDPNNPTKLPPGY